MRLSSLPIVKFIVFGAVPTVGGGGNMSEEAEGQSFHASEEEGAEDEELPEWRHWF